MPEETEGLLADGNGDQAAKGKPQTLPVNMYAADRAVVVVAPMPAIAVDDVNVTVGDGKVTITAERRTEAPKDYLLHEWHYGPYQRVIDLPDGYRGCAEATFANGQLALRVEKGDDGSDGPVPITKKP